MNIYIVQKYLHPEQKRTLFKVYKQRKRTFVCVQVALLRLQAFPSDGKRKPVDLATPAEFFCAFPETPSRGS